MTKIGKSIRANTLLFFAAVIWGGGFVAQRLGMQQLGPFLYNGFRFLLGALTLVPVMLLRQRQEGKGIDWGKTISIGIAAGFFLFFGATFQQLGLVHTTAGKAGFITGLYVIIVPLMGMMWGDKAALNIWLGAILAVIGLYFLSATAGLNFSPGDGFVLIGALFWAGHVQFLAKYSPTVDAFGLSFVQALFTSLISFGAGMVSETFDGSSLVAAFWPIIYGGVISIGLAYTMQVIAQQSAKPTPAAIILSLEAVFAAFWGWLFLKEVLTSRSLLGSGLMLAGMVLSQIQFGFGTVKNESKSG